MLSRLPLPVLYGLVAIVWRIAWPLSFRRRRRLRSHVARAFPRRSAREHRRILRASYANVATIAAEVIKAHGAPPQWLAQRVALRDVALLRKLLHQGRRVVLLAAHQANFEWLLHALSLDLGITIHVAYKPLHAAWADAALRCMRTRFGAKLISAKGLVRELQRERLAVRIVALLADQAPTSSTARHWTTFLNQDTAFYAGAEQIARMLSAAVVFVGMRRVARGHYEATFEPLVPDAAQCRPGELAERYVRCVERQIEERPGDWMWPAGRWRLKRPLYATSAPVDSKCRTSPSPRTTQ